VSAIYLGSLRVCWGLQPISNESLGVTAELVQPCWLFTLNHLDLHFIVVLNWSVAQLKLQPCLF